MNNHRVVKARERALEDSNGKQTTICERNLITVNSVQINIFPVLDTNVHSEITDHRCSTSTNMVPKSNKNIRILNENTNYSPLISPFRHFNARDARNAGGFGGIIR